MPTCNRTSSSNSTILGFSQFFNVRDTVAEAIAALSVEPAATPSSNDAIVPGFDDEKCEGLDIALERIGELEGGLLLSLDGYLDSQNGECFTRRVTRTIDAGFIRLVFEMREYDYSNEFGIGSFITLLDTVKPRGGDIAFSGVQPKVFETFQLLGFSEFFHIRDTVDEAIRVFSRVAGATHGENNSIVPGFDDEHDDALSIELRRIEGLEGGLMLSLTGYIDNHNKELVHRRLQKVIGAGFTWLVLDLQGVNYLTETGFGVLLSAKKPANLRGGDMVLAALAKKVKEVLDLLGFTEFVTCRATVDEALDAIRSAAAEPPTGNNAIVTGFDWEPCDHLSVSLKRIDGLGSGLLVTLSGYLNRENSGSFLRRLTRAVDAGFDRLILDMSDYFYTTDPGLASLTGICKAARGHGGDLVIINLPPMEKEVFRILGHDTTFVIRDTLDEAIAFLGGKPAASP